MKLYERMQLLLFLVLKTPKIAFLCLKCSKPSHKRPNFMLCFALCCKSLDLEFSRLWSIVFVSVTAAILHISMNRKFMYLCENFSELYYILPSRARSCVCVSLLSHACLRIKSLNQLQKSSFDVICVSSACRLSVRYSFLCTHAWFMPQHRQEQQHHHQKINKCFPNKFDGILMPLRMQHILYSFKFQDDRARPIELPLNICNFWVAVVSVQTFTLRYYCCCCFCYCSCLLLWAKPHIILFCIYLRGITCWSYLHEPASIWVPPQWNNLDFGQTEKGSEKNRISLCILHIILQSNKMISANISIWFNIICIFLLTFCAFKISILSFILLDTHTLVRLVSCNKSIRTLSQF